MLLRKAVRRLSSLRREGRRGGGDVGSAGCPWPAAARDRSAETAATKAARHRGVTGSHIGGVRDDSFGGGVPPETTAAASSDEASPRVDIDPGGHRSPVAMQDGCSRAAASKAAGQGTTESGNSFGDGVPPETTAATSSKKASLMDQLEGLCGKQELLLDGQASMVERQADLVECQTELAKCLGNQGRKISSVEKEIKDVREMIKAMRDELGRGVVDVREEELGDEEAEGGAGVMAWSSDAENMASVHGSRMEESDQPAAVAPSPSATDAVEGEGSVGEVREEEPGNAEVAGNLGGIKGRGVENGEMEFDAPTADVPLTGANVEALENLGGGEKGRANDEGVPPSGQGGGRTDRTRAYRANKRKRHRRNKRKRQGSVAPARNSLGGTGDGEKAAQDGAGGVTKLSRVAKFLVTTVGMFTVLSGLATQGNGLATLGHILGDAPDTLLDQDHRRADIRSEPRNNVGPANGHGEEHLPVGGRGDESFWEAFTERNEQAKNWTRTPKKLEDLADSDEIHSATHTEQSAGNGPGDSEDPSSAMSPPLIDSWPALQMELFGLASALDGPGAELWEGRTAAYIEDFYNNSEEEGILGIIKGRVNNLKVLSLKIVEQNFGDDTIAMGRPLQPSTSVAEPCHGDARLSITFSLELSYRTEDLLLQGSDAIVVFAFEALHFREAYIDNYLKNGDKFADLYCTSQIIVLNGVETLGPSTLVPAGSIFDAASPVASSSPTATAPPTASDRPTITRKESHAPAGQATTMPAPEGTSADSVIMDVGSHVPTQLATHPWSPVEKVCDSNPAKCVCPGSDGSDYSGPVNTSWTGAACLRWDDDDAVYPYPELDGNYCRNPYDFGGGPWCNTKAEDTEDGWGYCDIPACAVRDQTRFENINFYCVPDPSTCGCPNLRGSDYRGSVSKTKAGHACLRWDSFHEELLPPVAYSKSGLDGNSCRNPDNDPNGPWCFVKEDGSEREYCDIPSCVTNVCDADPMTCGCPHLSQGDYRGFINTTSSLGLTCARWDEKYGPDELVDVQEENYCRNPDQYLFGTGGDGGNGLWCRISDDPEEKGFCSVPACRTSSYVCDAAPDTCGCLDLRGSDYRGSANSTTSGLSCLRWDVVYDEDDMERYSSLDLEGNFCRNPNNAAGGPWCFTSQRQESGELDFEYCDVPACSALEASPKASSGPTFSSMPTVAPTASLSNTQTSCRLADKATCGCEDVDQTDYRGTISTSRVGLECVRWDNSEWFQITQGFDPFQEYSKEMDLQDNFCRAVVSWAPPTCFTAVGEAQRKCDIPVCPPCSCQPRCSKPNEEECGCPSFLQAENCCEDDDASCKCSYLKEACGKSIKNGDTEFCDVAEVECCKASSNDPYCECHMYHQICHNSPNETTCEFAIENEKCCDYEGWTNYEACYCDYYTHVEKTTSFKSEKQQENCDMKGANSVHYSKPSMEKKVLQALYDSMGGKYWFNSAGWLDKDTPHCYWYGIECNGQGRVSEIDLGRNNLTGGIIVTPDGDDGELIGFLLFFDLTSLDLGGNNLSGKIDGAYLSFENLKDVDLSDNNFSGHVDMSLFTPASRVNLSQNNFSSVSFTPLSFRQDSSQMVVASYKSLRVIDISNNSIDQEASKFFIDIPDMSELILSHNSIKGPLPNPFPPLGDLKTFIMNNNVLDGTLPDFHRSTPLLKRLDLSNQANAGFSGSIPATFSDLDDVSFLNLAGNNFSDSIPNSFGNFGQIKILNLSSNALDGSIPRELGRLEGILEVLDLSTNRITGSIPSSLADMSIHLIGNPNMSKPAPLSLCFPPHSAFDLKNDTAMCPPERNALKDFYDSSKGQEWTESESWGDEYRDHCSWHGVTCNSSKITAIKLPSNGLSGKMSERIGELSSLEVLDVSDNNINGPIPTGLGSLSNLRKLLLKYNAFSSVPSELKALTRLEVIQLQSNELTGTTPQITVADPTDASSFIADCGYPSDFDTALECSNCTMCCNNEGGCILTADNQIKEAGLQNYMVFSAFFMGILLIACFVLALATYIYDRDRMDKAYASSADRRMTRCGFIQQQRLDHEEKDIEFAMKSIGDESVYMFFLGKSRLGWMIALAAVGVQLWLLFVFVRGAEIDWTNELVDFVYKFKCPKDQDNCKTTSDLDMEGWALFWILMAAYLLKDTICGVKLLVLSGRERHHGWNQRIRYFVGGLLLVSITSFTLFVSAIYNTAIATSNTDIIMNSVIILFFTEIDELILGILVVTNEDWVEYMASNEQDSVGVEETAAEPRTHEEEDEEGLVVASQQSNQSGGGRNLDGEMQHLKVLVNNLSRDFKGLKKENAQLRSIINMSHDDRGTVELL